jgi:restriction system protein
MAEKLDQREENHNYKKCPRFVRYFAPIISALQDLGGSGRPSEVRDIIVEQLKISEEKQSELLANGTPRFDNQVGWARFYLVKSGHIDSSQRGVWSLTEKGRSISKMSHEQAMKIFRDIQAKFISKPQSDESSKDRRGEEDQELAPDEELTSTAGKSYKEQTLELLMSLSPQGFERFSQRLLRESGFEQVTVTGKSGDGGIDGIGILQVNPLVSFKVLFQCKRYASAVTPSQVRDFRGAMMGRADKGIIITTGTFTQEAKKEAVRDGVPPLELVDGSKLVRMLEQLEIGLKPKKTYEVDMTFFEEYQS